MIIVNLADIAQRYDTRPILQGLSWEIHSGQKIGLVGANGVGKSTLLRLIAGEVAPDSGSLYRLKGLRIGYLAQEPMLDPGRTIWDEVLSADAALLAVEQRMHVLEGSLGDPAVYGDDTRLRRALSALAQAQAEFERLGGYRHESRAREVLLNLGFSEGDLSLFVSALSGGQKKMLGLAKLLVTPCDLLLLDEPDNHLDLAGKAKLEQFVGAFEGTVVVVSHDRYLLDDMATTIAEIEDGRLTLYPGNYTAYATARQLRLLRQQQMYQAQQKEIARIEAAIARFEYWASIVVNERHIRQARSRRKMLERLDKIDKPVLERRQMGLELEGWRGSQKVLEIVGLSKRFEEGGAPRWVLRELNLLLWHGERVGLLGANGAGKSVLLRCILGLEQPTSGVIKIGPSIRAGYYAQSHETLSPEMTLLDEVRRTKPLSEGQAVSFLGRFLFPYRMVRQRVAELSGGERSRLQLAKLMLAEVNFLLLDEPTNNLDIPSCEVMEEALDEFEGTVLAISHDRYFLDRTVDRVVELDEGALVEYAGDYTYYCREKARRGNSS